MVRWIDALNPPESDTHGNTTYEIWGRLTIECVIVYFQTWDMYMFKYGGCLPSTTGCIHL